MSLRKIILWKSAENGNGAAALVQGVEADTASGGVETEKEGIVEAERMFSFGEVPLEVTAGDSLQQGSFSYAGIWRLLCR